MRSTRMARPRLAKYSQSKLIQGSTEFGSSTIPFCESQFTWSPLLSPASVALLSFVTLSMKMPKPLSLPPSRLKGSGESLFAFCSTTWRNLALAAEAMFSRRKWPFIFCGKVRKKHVICLVSTVTVYCGPTFFFLIVCQLFFIRLSLKIAPIILATIRLTSSSSNFAKFSRNCVIEGFPSKSLKWLFTHNNTIRVTYIKQKTWQGINQILKFVKISKLYIYNKTVIKLIIKLLCKKVHSLQ